MESSFACLGILLFLISPFLAWLSPQLDQSIGGYHIPIFEDADPRNRISGFLSYGGLTISFGVLALVAFWKGSFLLKILVGEGAILAGIMFMHKISSWNQGLLRYLIDQNKQYSELIEFTTAYLPTNRGVEPTFFQNLKISSVFDRYLSSGYFLSWGWFFCMIGGVVLLTVGYRHQKSPSGLKWIKAIFLVLPVVLAVSPMIPSVISEKHLGRADQLIAKGLYASALQEYNKARWWYSELDRTESFRRRLGFVYGEMGRKDEADFHIFKGYQVNASGNTLGAVFEFIQAENRAGDDQQLKNLIRRHLGNVYVDYGLELYDEQMIGGAIAGWQRAIRYNPDQIQVHYYLAKAYFDTGQFEQAIIENEMFIKRSMNPLMNSNVFMNIGDSYAKLDNPKTARLYYRRAISSDNDQNYRAVRSLVGP